MTSKTKRGMLWALGAAAGLIGAGTSPAQASLLLYEGFDYTANTPLGGSGTTIGGYTNPGTGTRWFARSGASSGPISPYDPNLDAQVVPGNLSYAGLATSSGNSVTYGSSSGAGLRYHDSIALPNSINSGNVYYSFIVRFNSAISGTRLGYASLLPDASVGDGSPMSSASASSLATMPAGAWIRNSGGTAYHLGGGKANGDGLGRGASAASDRQAWQSAAPNSPNQFGNKTAAGQTNASLPQTYFVVMKYAFGALDGTSTFGNTDAVSIYVNPIANTLGDNAGEVSAGTDTGSYYSALNAYTTADLDVTSAIQSFALIARRQNSSDSMSITLDELRIGTTWADVTPVPEPASVAALGLIGAGVLARRQRRS